MCIRDSAKGGTVVGLENNRVLAEVNEKFGGNYLNEETLIAVSYTHLRAHETVLDLVCRLLLEKKKNRRTIQHISI